MGLWTHSTSIIYIVGGSCSGMAITPAYRQLGGLPVDYVVVGLVAGIVMGLVVVTKAGVPVEKQWE